MYHFLKKNTKTVFVLFVLLLIVVGYSMYYSHEKKEYFVFKLNTPNGEVLLDQHDFANVINGIKPKSVKGTFTSDDLSELVRELKGLWIAGVTTAYNRDCKTSDQKKSLRCVHMKDVISLIHETNETIEYDGVKVTSKEEWLNAIIDTAFRIFPSIRPPNYKKIDKKVIKAIQDKKAFVKILN